MLKRERSAHRLLPDIQTIWTSREHCNLGTLGKVANRSLSRLKLWTGWGLSPEESLARLTELTTRAFVAETQGRWTQADFFWREVNRAFRRMPPEHPAWQVAATAWSVPTQAYEAVADEFLLDTHIALYNSYMGRKGRLSKRGHTHLTYIEELIVVRFLSPEARNRILGEALKQRIIDCKEAKEFDEAVSYALRFFQSFPDLPEAQELYASMEFVRATDGLQTALPSSRIGRVSMAISSLEKVRKAYPLCASLYDALGNLHHIRAVQHANATAPSDAMLDIEKALVYAPGMNDALDAKAKISELMQSLQHHVSDLLARVATTPNARLTAEGYRMKKQAERGFQIAEHWLHSEEAADIRQQLPFAHAANLWDRVGLDHPPNGWPGVALELVDGVNQVLGRKPSTPEEVESGWAEIVIARPALAETNPKKLFSFLDQHLFGQKEASVDETESPTSLLPISTVEHTSLEPLAYWLASRENPKAKLYLALALAIMLTSMFVAGHRWWWDHKEMTALHSLEIAHERESTLDELKACENYLSVVQSRARTIPPAIAEQCDTTFVRWFAQLKDLDAEAMALVQKYKSISSSIKGADGI